MYSKMKEREYSQNRKTFADHNFMIDWKGQYKQYLERKVWNLMNRDIT
jgi:hypothetical protein